MSYIPNSEFSFKDSPSLDAFGRLRTSNPLTIFDGKQIFDNLPLLFDDQEVSGSGTGSTHSTDTASSVLDVSATTAGKRVRQSFQRMNYQPGKSQLIFITFSDFNTVSGNTKEVGYFDDNNGVFLRSADGVVSAVIKGSMTGSAVDTAVAQADWNLDKMDGTGDSETTVDWSKSQIFATDLEWLGVGRVRIGLVIDGKIYYVHEFNNANSLANVYMSTPNLPVRYSIENDGTGAAGSFETICSSVISEGGVSKLGVLRHADSGSVSGLSTGTTYAVLGLRLKATHISMTALLEAVSLLSTTQNDQLHWEVFWNPTVAGTFTYSGLTNSGIEVATGSSSNTVTGGLEIDGGYLSTTLPVTNTTPNALRLGAAIDGTVDEIVLCARPITNNITVQGSLTWRELT